VQLRVLYKGRARTTNDAELSGSFLSRAVSIPMSTPFLLFVPVRMYRMSRTVPSLGRPTPALGSSAKSLPGEVSHSLGIKWGHWKGADPDYQPFLTGVYQAHFEHCDALSSNSYFIGHWCLYGLPWHSCSVLTVGHHYL
jgi:hypothetical protein